MSVKRDEVRLEPQDRALIDAINAAYRPPAPSRGFEVAVMARVQAPWWSHPPRWALGAALVFALLGWALPSPSPSAALSEGLAAPLRVEAPQVEALAWLDELEDEEQAMLPDDYQVLALIWASDEEDEG